MLCSTEGEGLRRTTQEKTQCVHFTQPGILEWTFKSSIPSRDWKFIATFCGEISLVEPICWLMVWQEYRPTCSFFYRWQCAIQLFWLGGERVVVTAIQIQIMTQLKIILALFASHLAWWNHSFSRCSSWMTLLRHKANLEVPTVSACPVGKTEFQSITFKDVWKGHWRICGMDRQCFSMLIEASWEMLGP